MVCIPKCKLSAKCRLLTGLGLLIVSIAVWSVLIEPRWVAKRTIDVKLPGSNQLAGLKVAIAADWHLTKRPFLRVMTVERAQAIVNEINASHPDVILLLGDYVADSDYVPTLATTPEDEIAHVLGQLKAPKGVYAVLGNHDWWREGNRMGQALVRHGIHVLENDAVPLPGTDAWIVGVGDDMTGHSNPAKAFKVLPASAPALIAMHEPISFSEFPDHLNAISFAGHTHGGQVNIPWVGALMMTGRTPINWAYGWVHHNANSMYVTSGLGVSILPVRFNRRPEWVMFTIQ